MSFSFNTGFQGANVPLNYLYVLPMIKDLPTGSSGISSLETASRARISWLNDLYVIVYYPGSSTKIPTR